MAQLTCELCGSTSFVKQDGFFVCGECGMKYSLAEARNMMSSETAPVISRESAQATTVTTPTEQITPLQKHLMNARRAMSKEDWQDAERYYNLAEQIDPNLIEAIFYSAYAKLMQLLLDADRFRREAACKILINCIPMISEHYTPGNLGMLIKLSNDLFKLAESEFVYTVATEAQEKAQMATAFANMHIAFAKVIEQVTRTYGEQENTMILSALLVKHGLQVNELQNTPVYQKALSYLENNDAEIKQARQQQQESQKEIQRIKEEQNKSIFKKPIRFGCLPTILAAVVAIIFAGADVDMPIFFAILFLGVMVFGIVIFLGYLFCEFVVDIGSKKKEAPLRAFRLATQKLYTQLDAIITSADTAPSQKEF